MDPTCFLNGDWPAAQQTCPLLLPTSIPEFLPGDSPGALRARVSPRAAAAKEPVNGACGFCNVDTCPIKSGLRPPADPVWPPDRNTQPFTLFSERVHVCVCVQVKGRISSLLLVFFAPAAR